MVATITVTSLIKYASDGFISVGQSNGCFDVIFATDIGRLADLKKKAYHKKDGFFCMAFLSSI